MPDREYLLERRQRPRSQLRATFHFGVHRYLLVASSLAHQSHSHTIVFDHTHTPPAIIELLDTRTPAKADAAKMSLCQNRLQEER